MLLNITEEVVPGLIQQHQRIDTEDRSLSRRTMSVWMIAVVGACTLLMEALLDSCVVARRCRSTRPPCRCSRRQPCQHGYQLQLRARVARGGPPDEPVLMYRHEPSRAARVAAEIIGDYQDLRCFGCCRDYLQARIAETPFS